MIPQWNQISYHNSIFLKSVFDVSHNVAMNIDKKRIVTLPITIGMYAILLILFFPHSYAITQSPSGPQCESTYTIIYNDPMKFNEAKTTDALKQSLSNIDFSADVLDGHPWWSYMHISKPDTNSTSTLTVPTVSGVVDNIVTKTMQGIDGVLKVDSVMTTWCN